MKEINGSTGSGGDIYAAATGRHRARAQISGWPEPPKDNTTGGVQSPRSAGSNAPSWMW